MDDYRPRSEAQRALDDLKARINKGADGRPRLYSVDIQQPVGPEDYDLSVTEFAIDDSEPFSVTEFDGTPPPRRWLLEGWLPTNYVTSLYGDGGVGKSLLAQLLGCTACSGGAFLGIPCAKVKVLAAFCEDDREEIWRRHHDILQGQDAAAYADFYVWIRVGLDNLLVTFNHDGTPVMSPFFKRLVEKVLKLRIEFLILDTVADLFGGNEIIRMQVNYFIKSVCAGLIKQANGNGHDLTVLLLCHPSESGKASGQGTSGSTAWNNAVRSRLYLERVPDGLPEQRRLSLKKANYAQVDQTIELLWDRGTFIRTNQDPTFARMNRISEAKALIKRLVGEAWDREQPFAAKKGHDRFLHSCMVTDLERRGFDKTVIVEALAQLERQDEILKSENTHRRGWHLPGQNTAGGPRK